MRVLMGLIIILFSTTNLSRAASPIYDLIGKSLQELNSAIGTSGLIRKVNTNDTMSIYQTSIGYQSFFIHESKIVMINSTSYWKTKKKTEQALDFAISLYKPDGFKVSKTSKNSATLTNGKYKVIMEVSFQEGQYQLSENIFDINFRVKQ